MSTRDEARHWRQARELFRGALELDTAKRPSFLDRAHGEGRLRRDVDLLLDSLGRAGDFLEEPVALRSEAPTEDPYLGLEVGPYRLGERLGRGGMGVVYLAGRIDRELEQQVAVKLLKPGANSREMVRRFRAERQILAALRHPNIAQLYDGGTTEGGLPYLVMEHVEGLPIDEHCEARALSVRRRLELFLDVCSAVHFAHQNLVVHRDLKPSNILVAGDGTPKLLDFGIAKLLGPEPAIDRTATAQRRMTPEYASPEQVKGAQVSTVSDIYSLGVLLSKLLTGRLPYRVTTGSPAELVKAICDEEPERLSVVIGRCVESPGPEPAKLRRRLAGDLDNIVSMALRKEPERRYGSAEQLAEDIRRHLRGHPVLARKDTFFYRWNKFIHRHRIAVAAATVFVMACLGFGIVMGAQRTQIAKERDRAQDERNRTEQVMSFLVDLFKVSDPYKEPGDPINAEEILREGVRRLESGLQEEPEIRTRLMATFGLIYRNLGEYDSAAMHYRNALKSGRTLFDDKQLMRAEILEGLATVLQAKGEYDAAEKLLRSSLMIRSKTLGSKHPDIGASLNKLAELMSSKGDFDTALSIAQEALQRQRGHFGNQHAQTAESLYIMGRILGFQYKYETAEPLYRQALAIRRQQLGKEHPSVGQSLGTLAVLLRVVGEYEEAEQFYREALAIRRKHLGGEHPEVGVNLNNLANLLETTGRIAEAQELLLEALEIFRKRLGDNHLMTAASLANLAEVYRQQEDYEEAEKLLLEALEICQDQPQYPEIYKAYTLKTLANVLIEKGEFLQAEQRIQNALSIFKNTLPDKDWRILTAEAVLADCWMGLGHYEESEALLFNIYPILKSTRGEDSLEAVEVLKTHIALYETWGKPEQAAKYRALLPGRLKAVDTDPRGGPEAPEQETAVSVLSPASSQTRNASQRREW